MGIPKNMLLNTAGTTPSPKNQSGSTGPRPWLAACTAARPITLAATRLKPFMAPTPRLDAVLLPVSFFGYSRRSQAGLGSRDRTRPWALFIRSGNA